MATVAMLQQCLHPPSIYAEDSRWLDEYGDTSVAYQQIIWLDDIHVVLVAVGNKGSMLRAQ